MAEDKLDQWIKKALEEEIEEEIRLLEENWNPSLEEDFAPSPETDRLILEAIQGRKKRATYKKVASLFLLLGSGLLGILALNQEVRAQALSYFEEWFRDHTAIHFVQKDKVQNKEWTIGYIPEGYEYKEAKDLVNQKEIIYENELGEVLFFGYASKQGAYTIGQDNENGALKKIKVGKYEAILYIAKDRGSMNMLMMDTEDYVFTLDGFLPEKELIKIAKSIEEKK